jgi:hypothetical protein
MANESPVLSNHSGLDSSYEENYVGFFLLPPVRAAVEALPEFQAVLAQCRADGFCRPFPVMQRRTPEVITNIYVDVFAEGRLGPLDSD